MHWETKRPDQGQTHGPPGTVHLPSIQSSGLLEPGESTKSTALPGLCPCGVPENQNLSGLDLGNAQNAGPTLDSALQSTLEPEQCRLGKHMPL